MGDILCIAVVAAASQRRDPEWIEELRFAPSVPERKDFEDGTEDGTEYDPEDDPDEDTEDWGPCVTWDTERFLWFVCLVAAGGFLLGFVARQMAACQPIAVTVHLNALLHHQ